MLLALHQRMGTIPNERNICDRSPTGSSERNISNPTGSSERNISNCDRSLTGSSERNISNCDRSPTGSSERRTAAVHLLDPVKEELRPFTYWIHERNIPSDRSPTGSSERNISNCDRSPTGSSERRTAAVHLLDPVKEIFLPTVPVKEIFLLTVHLLDLVKEISRTERNISNCDRSPTGSSERNIPMDLVSSDLLDPVKEIFRPFTYWIYERNIPIRTATVHLLDPVKVSPTGSSESVHLLDLVKETGSSERNILHRSPTGSSERNIPAVHLMRDSERVLIFR
nr:hypothetical protein Iba_chr14eCG5330 [Ipomoea batatas]